MAKKSILLTFLIKLFLKKIAFTESSSLTVECHQSCALMKSLSANSSRRNSDSSDPITFQELLQERRKLLTKYTPENSSKPTEDEPESKTPEWLLTRASIINKDGAQTGRNR